MDAVGGLKLIENFENEKGAIWRYNYPDQDFRLKMNGIYNTANLKLLDLLVILI